MKKSTEIKLKKMVTGVLKEELEYYQIDISLGRKFKKGKNSVTEPGRNFEISGETFVFRSAGTGGVKYSTFTIRDKNTALKLFQSLNVGIEISTGFYVISVGLFSRANNSYIAVK